MSFEFLKANAEALLMMILFSILGGVATYMRKLKTGKLLFSVAELVGEIAISMGAGLTVGLLLVGRVELPVVLAATSVAAHMGTRLIFLLENILSERLRAAVGGKGDPPV